MKLFFTLLAISCLTLPVLARDTSRNPDSRPSYGFLAGGSLDINAKQQTNANNPAQNQTRNTTNQSLNFLTDVLVPLSNSVSIQAGAGLTSNHTSSDRTSLLAASSTDRSSANALLSARYYFLDHSIVASSLTDNPDQWPSLAWTVTGADSIYREQEDLSNTGTVVTHPGSSNQSLSLTGDARLPVRNAWTLLANLGATLGIAQSPQTPNANGTETRTKTLTFGGGVKYYLVGRNFIAQDEHKNPDRWISMSLTSGGIINVGSHQITTSAATGTDDRDISGSGFNIASELRFPVTNNLTFRIGMNGGVITQEVALTKSNGGSKTTTPSFAGFAGIRGYFL